MEAAGFNVLACELASRAAHQHDPLHYTARRFLEVGYNATNAEIEAAAKKKCQLLQIANVDAVNQRYGENTKPEPLIWKVTTAYYPSWSEIQLLSHLTCLRYQMSEGNVPDTTIYNQLDDLIGDTAETLVRKLPEYDKAAWGW
jgi:hypothetical protein